MQQANGGNQDDGQGGDAGVPNSGISGVMGPELVSSHRSVAFCLSKLGCDDQAESHLLRVLQATRAARDSSKRRDLALASDGNALNTDDREVLLAVAAAAEELARCYSRQGKHHKAEECYWEALEIRRDVLGEQDELVLQNEDLLRQCLDLQCNT